MFLQRYLWENYIYSVKNIYPKELLGFDWRSLLLSLIATSFLIKGEAACVILTSSFQIA